MSSPGLGSTTSSSSSDGYSSRASEKEGQGQIGENSVELATNQSSKGWYILALVVGSLVFVGGVGFGATGLMQANGVFSFPPNMQWLTSAFNTVNNALPLSGCLWIMTVGGGVVSITLIAVGSVGIDRERRKEKAEADRKEEEYAAVIVGFRNDLFILKKYTDMFIDKPNKVLMLDNNTTATAFVVKSDLLEDGTVGVTRSQIVSIPEAERILNILIDSGKYSELECEA